MHHREGWMSVLRRLHRGRAGSQRPGRVIHLLGEHKKDLEMWVTFLRSFNGKSMLRFVETGDCDVTMGSDASKSGVGGFLGSTPVAGVFSPEWSALDSETLELYPILAMVGTFTPKLENLRVRVLCDSQPLVYYLNFRSHPGTRGSFISSVSWFCCCHITI